MSKQTAEALRKTALILETPRYSPTYSYAWVTGQLTGKVVAGYADCPRENFRGMSPTEVRMALLLIAEAVDA